MTTRIAAITMVRGGGHYLGKWVSWYGDQLGRSNLFIIFDGTDQVPPPCTQGCNIRVVPRVEGNVARGDRGRIRIVSDLAASLLKEYRFVIGTDVDEYLAADPARGISLADYLSLLPADLHTCYSALGCDVVQRLGSEGAMDWDKPFMEQRSFALLSTRYTKACILCRPAEWGSGFHRVRGSNYHILDGLYLFHYGCSDASDLEKRRSDEDLAARGWSRHLRKRQRLFRLVRRLKARDWETWTRRARRIQSVCHPPYAWNKPAMPGPHILVRIPERFRRLF